MHLATKEFKIEILKAKQNYKVELENKMAANNSGSAWPSMKIIAVLQISNSSTHVTTDVMTFTFMLDGFNLDTEFANALVLII